MKRGLLMVQSGKGPFVRAVFTEAELAALRRLAGERRCLDPLQYAHVRQELGLEQTGVEELGTKSRPAS